MVASVFLFLLHPYFLFAWTSTTSFSGRFTQGSTFPRADKFTRAFLQNHSTSEDEAFEPKFDGQLYYGLPAKTNKDNDDVVVEATPAQLREMAQARIRQNSESHTKTDNSYRTNPSCINGDGNEQMILPGHNLPIRSRTVPINSNLSVTVWEVKNPASMVNEWMMQDTIQGTQIGCKQKATDPFGSVMWPGSIAASQLLLSNSALYSQVFNGTVLILGAGVGIETLTVLSMTCAKIYALDNSHLALDLLRFGATGHLQRQELGAGNVNFQTEWFDITNMSLPLPHLQEADVVVIADVLYNVDLARAVGSRVVEVCQERERRFATAENSKQHAGPTLVVTDSQRFHGTDFLSMVREELLSASKQTTTKDCHDKAHLKRDATQLLQWKNMTLHNVTASGVVLDDDQTYDIQVRYFTLF